jgi:hypothetical protein
VSHSVRSGEPTDTPSTVEVAQDQAASVGHGAADAGSTSPVSSGCCALCRRSELSARIHRHPPSGFGLYMGRWFAPNHKGMPIIGARENSTTSAGKSSTHATCAAAGHRPATRRAEPSDRTPPFPNMPRASLRHAQHLVRSHCDNLGITYTETSLSAPASQRCATSTASGTATDLSGQPSRRHTKSLGRYRSAARSA